MNQDVKIAAIVIGIIVIVAIIEANPSSNSFEPTSTQTISKASSSSNEKSCYHNGIELKGKVQFVDSFPDLKIKYVSSFPDINVQFVSSFPSDCGQWQIVDSFPDFTVQEVSSFPDIEVKKVSSFPGME